MKLDEVERILGGAESSATGGDVRGAIELLTTANRRHRDSRLERALVRLRREWGVSSVARPAGFEGLPIEAEAPTGTLHEVDAPDLTVEAVRTGFSRSGCVLVRGLVPPERAARLASGIDAALQACDDASTEVPTVDRAWYDPGPMPDREGGLSESENRRFLRDRGGLWTADSPRMLFELFELVDDTEIGAVMTGFLGERPVLSAHKCTLRRVPPDLVVQGGWHQDGAFLGERIGAFNVWIALTRCGVDAPGLDVLPKRVDHVLASDDESRFDWSLSDRAVREVAEGMPIVRPEFQAGDALLFDHLFVHRTATSPGVMTRPRHAIEAWFFAPSAYPTGQLPLLY